MTAPCPTFGFLVAMELTPGLDPSTRNGFRYAWSDFLDSRGLYCGGAGGEKRHEYAVLSEASQATEADRVSTEAWLQSRGELCGWYVGVLEDLGAGPPSAP